MTSPCVADVVEILNDFVREVERTACSQREFVRRYNTRLPEEKKPHLQTINSSNLGKWASNALKAPTEYPGVDSGLWAACYGERGGRGGRHSGEYKEKIMGEWALSGKSQRSFVDDYNERHPNGPELNQRSLNHWVGNALKGSEKNYPNLNFSQLRIAHARFAKKEIRSAVLAAAGAPVLAGPSRAPLDNACVSYADPARLAQVVAVPGAGVVLPGLKELFGDTVPGVGSAFGSVAASAQYAGPARPAQSAPEDAPHAALASGDLPSLKSLGLLNLPAGPTSPAQQTAYRPLQGNTARPAGPSRGR